MHTPSANKGWVLITGASSGFGEEFARQYAEQGHALVLVARRLDRLQNLAEALRQQHGSEVVVEQVDLSDVAAIVRLQECLRERGIAIDVLINNAGHGLQGPFADASLDSVLSMVQLDVASLTAVTHVFAQDMRQRRRGKILLVASMLAYQAWKTSPSIQPRRLTCCAWVKPFIASSSAMAHGHGAVPGHVGHWIRQSRATKNHDHVEALDDEASLRRSCRYSGVAQTAHQRCAGLVEQGLGNFHVGNTTLAASGRFLSGDEFINRKDLP
jgi:NAD(P)-dependent dehydrogenase (short-subunit alcohol dehydrogenase family)